MPRRPTGNPVGRPASEQTKLVRAVQHALAGGTSPIGKTSTSVKNRYDAAGRGRRMAGWNPPSSGPNRAIEGLQTIRNRARDSSRNDWSGESAVQKRVTHLVGIGITPRFKGIDDKDRKREIIDLWNDFAQVADADCVLNIYGLQSLVVRTWIDGGECFARRRARFDDEGLPVPFQIQLLEPEMVPLLDTDSYAGLPAGNIIRSGIEFNRRGKRVAYWVYKQHPGDVQMVTIDAEALVRVAASDMCHVFRPLRPGQLRGVSLLAPILPRLRNIESYDDATLERQKLANMLVGFISRTLPAAPGEANIDPLTNQPIEEEGPSGPLLGLQPGLMQELDDGQKVEWSNPPEAGTTYSDYMRTQHMGTAAAAGIPYELFSGDILNISDRTLRVLINEYRRLGEQEQWQIVIPMFCQRVIEWFAQGAVFAGKAAETEFDAIRRVEHAPHGWAHIHPVQDPTGKKLEVDAGFISRASVIGAKGDDPDAVDEERQADDKREQTLKVGPYSKSAQQIANPPAPAPAPAPGPGPNPQPKN
jgi:lambda family phage portal protein